MEPAFYFVNSSPSMRQMMRSTLPIPLVWLTAANDLKAARHINNCVGPLTQPCFGILVLVLNDPDCAPSYIIHPVCLRVVAKWCYIYISQHLITNGRILELADATSIDEHVVRSHFELACEAHARYPITETSIGLLYSRAFAWQEENRWAVDTLQRQTDSQPDEVWDGTPTGSQSRWPSLLATYISYSCCKHWAKTDNHGG